MHQQCILCQPLQFLNGNQDTSRAPNNNKHPCLCQTSLRNVLFHLVQCISLHFKLPDLYLSCTTKLFPKFLLPFQCQASFQSEQFGSYDYAPCRCHWSWAGRVLFVKSGVAHAHAKKTPVQLLKEDPDVIPILRSLLTDSPSSPGKVDHTTRVYVSYSFQTVVWGVLCPTRSTGT